MLDAFRIRMNALGSYGGEVKRRNAQKIMDASWMRDPATRPVYVKWVDSGLPDINEDDEPVYAKYNVKSYHNITGDEIAYLLQFRLEDMKNNSDIKVGSYVRMVNEMDEVEWWLIVHYDDRNQFRQFSILKCTWTYKWVSSVDGKRVVYSCLGAPRKQNSYNSGVWLDYTTQTVENQEVMWLPTNSDTKTILYDTKFLKSSQGREPALKWTVTKIEDTAVKGITKFTLAQTQFDPSKDDLENGIADYKEFTVKQNPEKDDEMSNIEITYSGAPTVKAGGGYKKFCLKELANGDLVNVEENIKWYIGEEHVNVDGDSVYNVKIGGNEESLECDVNGNVFKVKFPNDYSLIGSTFTITATTQNDSKSIVVEVVSL